MRVYEVPHFHFGQGQIDGHRRPLPGGETRRVHLLAASARQEGLQEEERRRRGSGGEGPGCQFRSKKNWHENQHEFMPFFMLVFKPKLQ